jgi:peptidylprolyl isomerase
MIKVKKGDQVKVHYTGKFEDGKIFDSSTDREPLLFTIGEGNLISGFEKAVMDLEVGESKTVKIKAIEGYGLHQAGLVFEINKDKLPENIAPQVGQELQLVQQDGRQVPAVITAISDSGVTIDANHPLAGRDLIFDIELIEVL